MCGICGHTNDRDGAAVERMNRTMVHRGPDDGGVYVDRDAGLALGARRLSIIDVEGGHQPLSNEDGSVWVALNGEIYNHPELRERLRARGHRFASDTDTEVLVHLYEEQADALVHSLEGMYAFAIWDSRRGRLLVARDRWGEKPLFFSEQGGELVFASELTTLRCGLQRSPGLDHESVDAFFVFGYVPGPQTLAEGVRQLPPAHLLTWERGAGTPAISRYWSPVTPQARPAESWPMLVAETKQLLRHSVRRRLMADVPVGVLLSGGVDSALVAALAAEESTSPITTFTVGYDVGSVNETSPARHVAELLGSEHGELILTENAVGQTVPQLLAAIDQPLADQALVSLHAVSRFARSEVKVALGGEGADELFGGYPRYRSLPIARRVAGIVPPLVSPRAIEMVAARTGRSARFRRAAHVLAARTDVARNVEWVTAGRSHQRRRLYGPALTQSIRDSEQLFGEYLQAFDGQEDVATPGRLMHIDQMRWLPDDVLVKADRASMLVGLEMRAPYLDREVAEFAASVDVRTHLRNDGKALLRHILGELIPPIAGESRPKTAFRAPASDWLRGPLAQTFEQQLARGAIFEHGLFDRSRIGGLWRGHREGRRDATDVLWPLLCFGVWLDRFVGVDGG
jgi:asparagine synthase (glutamine-hydrolysing)